MEGGQLDGLASRGTEQKVEGFNADPDRKLNDFALMLSIYHKEAGRQLFQLLLQLVADLRQTLTLDVLQFQFLRFEKGELHTRQKDFLALAFFFPGFLFRAKLCQHKVNVTTPSLQRPAALGGSPSPSL